MDYKEKYNLWISSDLIDVDTKNELKSITDEKEIEDRFYRDLEFGTGGLRGVIGAGSNRMNIYTVGKATQGLADYLNSNYIENISASIAYDSRNKSDVFSKMAASVLAANGIKVYIFESLRPTPMLSFSVRHLCCKAGIVVTASHNPKQYNGYKVYGDDGGQVTDENAGKILSLIESVDDFDKIKHLDFDTAVSEGKIVIIGEAVDKAYIDKVKSLTIRKDLLETKAKELKIIYTPIHGSGNVPVRRALKELGYENVHVVKEQELPDGNFPTASYPNPEQPSVFKLALELAKDVEPDIIFGTDPDCDRIGVVVKDKKGEYQVLTGNQTGALLTNYILSSLSEKNKLSSNSVVVKTIVTTEMAREICKYYGTEIIDVLTGFKYIGEKIKEFEDGSKNYVLGFEESYGYLSGTFVRDKDAVIASTLICEMALYYKSRDMSLYDGLMELYEKFGYYKESLVSMEFKGKEGQEKMNATMEDLRNNDMSSINGVKILKAMDYKLSKERNLLNNSEMQILLPKSNVLKYVLEDKSYFVVRPSGTEPKMKVYFGVTGENQKDAEEKLLKFKDSILSLFD